MNDIDEIGMQTAKATAAMLAIAKLVQERTRERGQKQAELRLKIVAASRKYEREMREAALRTKRQEKELDPRNVALNKIIESRGTEGRGIADDKISLAKEPVRKVHLAKEGLLHDGLLRDGMVQAADTGGIGGGKHRGDQPMSPQMRSVQMLLNLDNARSPMDAVREPVDRTVQARTADARERARERER
jgi:hypothetical protein